ncbi:MAG: hypothetical protein AAF402_04940 [Pseudomonadota bacterium]
MTLSLKTDTELLELATPIMDNLMDGSTERDWSKHVRDFTEDGKQIVDRAAFAQQCEEYQSRHGYFKPGKLSEF